MCVCLIRYNRNEGGKSRIAKQKSEKTQRMRKDVNEGRQKCEKSVYAAQLKRRKRTTTTKKKAHNSRPQFALSCSISRIVHLFVQHCTFADYLREKKKRQQVHFECLQSTSSQRV